MLGFKVNRPLNTYEQLHHFDVKQRASDKVHYELSLTQLNSTYVEGVDKWYAIRGGPAMISMVGCALMLFLTCFCLFVGIKHSYAPMYFAAAFSGSGLAGMIYLFTRDAFAYTHYPIRFNRKNRQVYAFRRNGTVLKAAWDEMYWTIHGTGTGLQSIFVAGHVLTPDGHVKETIGLAQVAASMDGVEELQTFFEFYRRYMEEGPERVLNDLRPTPLIMLPGIHKQKETWRLDGNGSPWE